MQNLLTEIDKMGYDQLSIMVECPQIVYSYSLEMVGNPKKKHMNIESLTMTNVDGLFV